MNKVILCFAHWDFKNSSRVNKALIEEVKKSLPQVEIRDLYSLYSNNKFNSHFDTTNCKKSLEEASDIIWQFPFQWYYPPALFKQWIDDLLVPGWAHSIAEPKLKNKKLHLAITMGGDEKAYTHQGFNAHNVEDFISGIKQTAKFCEIQFCEIFKVHDTVNITEDKLKQKAQEYVKFISSLSSN
jgi:putative NADPH-quinone reductase